MNPIVQSDRGSLAPASSAPPQREQQAFDALLVCAFKQGPDAGDAGAARAPAPEVDPDLVLSEEDERALGALGADFADQVLAEPMSPWACTGTTCGPGGGRSVVNGDAAPANDEQPGFPVPFGGYELLTKLGHGGMGVVYKARQKGLNRVVALKTLQAGIGVGREALARFLTEVELLAQVQHPNIVQVYDVGEHDGQPYFSMEFMEGGSLARKLASTPQPARSAAELVETLARALEYAHRRGIVHRDLKPANVLLAADGAPKIADFGLAKRLDCEVGQTQTGAILGTPSYMAPEQAEGHVREVGRLADVYALGVILYECLTGRPPFKAATVWETLAQVREQEPVPVRQLIPAAPRDLETVCLKCLQKQPAKRYDSAEALADDLRRFLVGEPIRARPVGLAERALKSVRRRPTAAALLVLTMTSAVCLSTLYSALGRSNRELSEALATIERLKGGQGQLAGDHASAPNRVQQLRHWLAGGPGAPAGVARLLKEPTLKQDLDNLNMLLGQVVEPERPGGVGADTVRDITATLDRLRYEFQLLLADGQARDAWSLQEEAGVKGFFALVEDEVFRL
jgi:serine/threonine protein kinase